MVKMLSLTTTSPPQSSHQPTSRLWLQRSHLEGLYFDSWYFDVRNGTSYRFPQLPHATVDEVGRWACFWPHCIQICVGPGTLCPFISLSGRFAMHLYPQWIVLAAVCQRARLRPQYRTGMRAMAAFLARWLHCGCLEVSSRHLCGRLKCHVYVSACVIWHGACPGMEETGRLLADTSVLRLASKSENPVLSSSEA